MTAFKTIRTNLSKRAQTSRTYVTYQIKKRPITSFLLVLALVFLFIIFGNILNKPQKQVVEEKPLIKSVTVYHIGQAPKIQLQGRVEKTGIIQIVAQTAGIVTEVAISPGDIVNQGQILVSLSSTYTGANAPALQAAIAKKQNDIVKETYEKQKDIIKRQKELAEKTDANNDKLRDINAQSISETQTLLDLNQTILTGLDEQINTAPNASTKLQFQQLKSQFLSATNQLQSQKRQLEYQSNNDNPPSQLSDLQKEITIKQLEIQEKTLQLNREISNLQLQLAYISASLMNPSSPVAGRVERVYVKYGESVNPGTPLVLISQLQADPTILVQVPRDTAKNISLIENSVIHMGDITFATTPSYISTEATDGQLYTAYFPIPENYAPFVTDKAHILVDVPIGYPDTGATISFVPLDAIFQTQDGASVNVVKHNKVVSKKVTLGQVYGRYVQILAGLTSGDIVILNRNVVEGDTVSIQN